MSRQGSMTAPKLGDTVHVDALGVVIDIDGSTTPYRVKIGDFGVWLKAAQVSKIVGPEPQWKVGDAIIFTSLANAAIATLVYNGIAWHDHDGVAFCTTVTPAWQDGRIVRLVPEVQT